MNQYKLDFCDQSFCDQKRSAFSFPKALRLRSRREFQFVSKNHTPLFGRLVVIEKAFVAEQKNPKLGITVTRRFGKAHCRNLFKRRVREVFRILSNSLPAEYSLNIKPRPYASNTTYQELLHEISSLLNVSL